MDASYLGQLQDPPSELVFIIGCHRSGTSLLYHLLAYTGQLDYLSAYDIIKYDELLHNRITGREAQVKADPQRVLQKEASRGLDDLPVGADLPEEYRFVMPQEPPGMFLNIKKRLDRLSFAPCLTPRSQDAFMETCRKIADLPAGQYVSVRYEDLCADPAGCLSGIGRQLRLNLVPRVPAKFVAPRHLPIPERVKRHYAGRVDDITPYLQHCHYAAWQE
jgi:hypothetical protein